MRLSASAIGDVVADGHFDLDDVVVVDDDVVVVVIIVVAVSTLL